METGKSRVDNEEVLVNLIKKYSGVTKVNRDADLEWNIGLTGDDAVELLTEYSKKFAVDVSKFPFHEYFYDEGQNIILMINRLFRRYKKKKITLETLLMGIQKGRLE